MPGSTLLKSSAAARLDRTYVPDRLMPYVHTCRVTSIPGSDHLPLVLLLLPAAGGSACAKGLWRTDVRFVRDTVARAQLQALASHLLEVGLQMEPAELLDWWP